MDSRRRFRDYVAGTPVDRPPRFESQIPDDTVDAWRKQGLPQDVSPHEYFGLDERECVPLEGKFRQAADKVIYADVYPRGFLQEMGVKDSATLTKVLLGLSDEPSAAELVMGKYTDFLVEVIHTRYSGLDIQYFLYSEPIASPTAPVISPRMYRRFVLPCLTRLVREGRSIGVREHVLSTRGGVRPLIPDWIETGINGLWIGHAAAAGIDYLELRREYGSRLGLWGGVDNRVLYQGDDAIAREVDRVSPLFSSGRYIAMADDTIRPQVQFAAYAHYRRLLDEVRTP